MAEEEDQVEENAAEGGEEGEGGAEGGDKKKLILFIALPILLLAGIGAGLYFSGMLDSLLGKNAAQEQTAGEEGGHGSDTKKEASSGGEHGGGHGEEGAGASDAFLEIPTMIVNLDSQDENPRYLRLTVQLELKDPSQKEEVQAVMPRVVDQFQTYLRELRVSDLRGSAGLYRLQIELLRRVNQAAYPVEIKNVLFQEILIQ